MTMKCIDEYKKKVREINERYDPRLRKARNANDKNFKAYLKELEIADTELVIAIRKENGISVWSMTF